MPDEGCRPFDIAIVGETNLDLVLYGLPETMPVERELLASGFELTLGGSSSILAHNLAVLGSRVAFATLVGDDEMGQIALGRLRHSGLHLLQIPHKKGLGTGVTVLLPHGNRRHILTSPGAISGITTDDLDVGCLSSARHFHLSSFFLQTSLHNDLPNLFKRLKAAGLTISLDTNDDPSGRWSDALDQLLDSIDLLLPNEGELKQIAKKDTLEDALSALSERIPLIVVKCGSRGAIVQHGKRRTGIPPVQVTPVDTIGAGDSFNAGFLHSYLRNNDPLLAAAIGNATGALSTLRPGGTEAFRDAELRETFLSSHAPSLPRPRSFTPQPELHGSPGNLTNTDAQPDAQDKFVAMVTAKGDVKLSLSDFHPVSMLHTPLHEILKPRYPVVDYHNHLDAQDPGEVLRIMDECGIEHIVNITMKVGDEALKIIDRFRQADAQRFSTIGWMDWTGVERDDFIPVSLDRINRLFEAGIVAFKIWKDLGLTVRDRAEHLLHVDDERLAPIFDHCGELGIPVMVHIGDPEAFFLPIDANNERLEELSAHPDWSFYGSTLGKYELLAQRDCVFKRHPKTTFVAAHIGENSENLENVAAMLEANPNVLVDISARVSELGRQPYSARRFFLRFSDRILFGSDLVPEINMYRLYYRFLETEDEYFEYPSHASRQGRWNIYGINLPSDILRKVYRDNALKLLAQSQNRS